MTSELFPDHRTLLACVLNTLIPARGDLPGAGDLGLAEHIDATMATAPGMRLAYLEGLQAIQNAAVRAFWELAVEEREGVLRAVEADQPIFFAGLVEHAYLHYYTDPRVQRIVGLSDDPPQPRGYWLPSFDEDLLTMQKARDPFWRSVP